jgi:tRNA-specific 2-thiouridylase
MSSVMVAMSGGVDSSVAAAIAVEEGHDVIGVTMRLWEGPDGSLPTAGCCTVADAEDARRVAAQLDIPYYVLDYSEAFRDGVVDRFLSEYAAGRTPNPCIECNRTVKFTQLLDRASELDCELLYTGHYARNVAGADGRRRLLRGVDRRKDQSYVLSMLDCRQLDRLRFPVGFMTKDETRAAAGRLGLRTADKPDSQDICFVGSGDYRGFVETHAPETRIPGPVVTTDGDVVGSHEGIVDFTVGQRRGLGVAVGEPRYVTRIDAATSTVVIGSREDLAIREIELSDLTWVSGHPPVGSRIDVQVRAHGEAVPAERVGSTVRLDRTEHGVAPGQTAALYRGDEVVGGGIVSATIPERT